MVDYRDIFKEENNRNWAKCVLAVNITREGLIDFVNREIKTFQTDILNNVYQSLPAVAVGTTCGKCTTPDVIPCPTRNVCAGRLCKFHTFKRVPCQTGICTIMKKGIEAEHRFSFPSWKNTDARLWCSNAWEIAKCYLPPDGYSQVHTATETDFNGVLSVILNCNRFAKLIACNLSNTNSIFHQAREIGRNCRHCPDLKIDSASTNTNIDTLIDVLKDFGICSNQAAIDALAQLNQLKQDTLTLACQRTLSILEEAIDSLKTQQQESANTLRAELIQKHEELKKTTDAEIDVIKRDQENLNSRVDKLTENVKQIDQKLNEHTEKSPYEEELRQNENLKTDLQRDLVHYYEERHSTVPLSPLASNEDVPLKAVYVPLRITHHSRKLQPQYITEDLGTGGRHSDRQMTVRSQNEPIRFYKDIFFKQDKTLRNIYIQGEPGRGKSTFSTKIVLDWCDAVSERLSYDGNGNFFTDIEYLKSFRFLFHISLRDSDVNLCDIYDMIHISIVEELAQKRRYDKDFLEKTLREEQTLVILDGLDEWTHPKNGCSRTPQLFPHRPTGTKCTFLTFSRPWRFNDISLKASHVDVLLDLHGVVDSDTLLHKVFDYLDNEHGLQRDILEFRKQSKHIQYMLRIPILLVQLLCYWYETERLPESKCQLYAGLIDMLGQRSETVNKKEGGKDSNAYTYIPKCFENKHWCERNLELLDGLGHLAFYSLHSIDNCSYTVFSDTLVNTYLHDAYQNTALNSGLLTQNKVMSLIAQKSTYRFLHKTYQEFLAAHYLATHECELETLLEALRPFYGKSLVLGMQEIFVFLCGMNPNIVTRLTDLIWEEVLQYLRGDQDAVKEFEGTWILLHKMLKGGLDECHANGYLEFSAAIKSLRVANIVPQSEISLSRPDEEKNESLEDALSVNYVLSDMQNLKDSLSLYMSSIVCLYMKKIVLTDSAVIQQIETLSQLEYIHLEDILFQLEQSQKSHPDMVVRPKCGHALKTNTPLILGKLVKVARFQKISYATGCPECDKSCRHFTINLEQCVNLERLIIMKCVCDFIFSQTQLKTCVLCEYNLVFGNILKILNQSGQMENIELWKCQNIVPVCMSLHEKRHLQTFVLNFRDKNWYQTGLYDLVSVFSNDFSSGGSNLGDCEITVPGSLQQLNLTAVNMTSTAWTHMLQFLPSDLHHITLDDVDLGDVTTELPLLLKSLRMHNVSMTPNAWLQILGKPLSGLQDMSLNELKLGDLHLQLPDSLEDLHVYDVSLNVPKWSRVLRELPENLLTLNMQYLHLKEETDLEIILPLSVRNVSLEHVFLPGMAWKHFLKHLKERRLVSIYLESCKTSPAEDGKMIMEMLKEIVPNPSGQTRDDTFVFYGSTL